MSDWLAAAIDERRPFALGELDVTFDGDDAVIVVPGTEGLSAEVPADVARLRQWARTGEDRAYRPLSGARGLRRGWHTRVPIEQLRDALDAVYPLAPLHIARAASGDLRIASAADVLGRQSGRYQAVRELGATAIRAVRETLCDDVCLRTPFWVGNPALEEGTIPCPEPCSVFVSLAREVALAGESATPSDEDPSIPFAAFDEPGNPLRERTLIALREPETTG